MLREGAKVRRARKRRSWTQNELGARIGLSQSSISHLERGDGGSLSVQSWQRVAIACQLPLNLELGRDPKEEPADAGHLAVQELVLRVGRLAGYARTFELPTRPANPSLSTDVGLIDDRRRLLIQVECVNTFGNINASIRSSHRKRAEAEELAIAMGHGAPYVVHQCWVIRATRRNRQLLSTYPELFASRFTGSSRAWVKAMTTRSGPPTEPGPVWCDVAARRLFEWRSPAD